MAEIVNKYPVGIQTFEMIREEGLKHYLDLLAKGMDAAMVMEITGLSESQLQQLKE